MRGRATRSALVLGSAGLLVLGIAACSQASPEQSSSQSNLKIVEQVQIDENGKPVQQAAAAAPADPAGNGKATCPPVNIAMAGALNGPNAALGINIKYGVQLAVDKHNAANPGCQVQLKTFDTEGDPQKATAIAPQIVDDAFTVGLVGPAFSGPEAIAPLCGDAGDRALCGKSAVRHLLRRQEARKPGLVFHALYRAPQKCAAAALLEEGIAVELVQIDRGVDIQMRVVGEDQDRSVPGGV